MEKYSFEKNRRVAGGIAMLALLTGFTIVIALSDLGCGDSDGVQGVKGVKGVKGFEGGTGTTVEVANNRGESLTVYMLFNADSCYDPSHPSVSSVCAVDPRLPKLCSFSLDKAGTKPTSQKIVFPFDACSADFNISANNQPSTGCSVNQAELSLNQDWGKWGGWQNTFDISLVNGFNIPMSLVSTSGTGITVTTKSGNKTNDGVYPYGCDNCTGNQITCTGVPKECKASTVDPCQYNEARGSNYTVNFLK